MLPLWRLEHDWIHRSKAGQLDFLKKSVIYCKKIHIRSKSVSEISLHAIKNFFETSIEPKKLDQMRQIKPDVNLLRASSLEGIKSNVLGILNKHNDIMLKSSEILFQQQQLEKAVRWKRCALDKGFYLFSNDILDSGGDFGLSEEHVAHQQKGWLYRKANWVPDKGSRNDVEHAADEMR